MQPTHLTRAALAALLFAGTSLAQISVGGSEGSGPFHQALRLPDEADYRPARGHPYVLSFVGGDWEPPPGVDERLRRTGGDFAWAYVMLAGRFSSPEKRDALRRLGVELQSPHTWQSWLVRLPLRNLDAIAALPFVRWIGWPQPRQKLTPALQAELRRAEPTDVLAVDISVRDSDLDASAERIPVGQASQRGYFTQMPTFRRVPHGPIRRQLEALGFAFAGYDEIGSVRVFSGRAPVRAIAAIAELPVVASLGVQARLRPHRHDQSMAMIGQDVIRGVYGGAGTPIGIMDSGLSAQPGEVHADFLGKWFVGFDSIGDPGGAFVDGLGHGTSMLGTICGAGVADARYRGAAITAGTLLQKPIYLARVFDDDGGSPQGIGDRYLDFAQDYVLAQKPRLVNCSWGAGSTSAGTDNTSVGTDLMVWQNDQLYVFATGNGGILSGAERPSCAKNVLAVGSCNDRPHADGPVGALDNSTSNGTDDGRRKPDLLAPGQSITSTKAGTTTGYSTESGTSGATAHVTGVLASLVEHYPQYFDLRPAVLKAHAIASAEYLGQATGPTDDGWHGQAPGWGVLDAVKMHGSPRTGWQVGWESLPATSGTWTSWDIAVPNDAVHAKLILAWSEPPAAEGATAARLADLRLFVDVPPYSMNGDEGEMSQSSDVDTVIGLAGDAFTNLVKGQTVRVKVFGQALPVEAKVGISLLWMKANPAGTVGMDLTLAKDSIQVGESVGGTAKLLAAATTHHFDNARFEHTPSMGWEVLGLSRLGFDGVLSLYNGFGHPSDPWPSLANGMVVGSGILRELGYTLRGAQEGVWPVKVTAFYDPGALSKSVTRQLCVDSSPPADLTDLASPTHTPRAWSAQSVVVLSWIPGGDRGCAGIGGFAWSVSEDEPGTPPRRPTLPAHATRLTAGLRASARGQYLNLISIDRAGNASRPASFGPLLIDTSAPAITGLEVAGGATTTPVPRVPVLVLAQDTFSGMHEVRVGNGDSWLDWRPWSDQGFFVDLAQEPWGSAPGSRVVCAQVRDRAGNVSSKVCQSIVFAPQ